VHVANPIDKLTLLKFYEKTKHSVDPR